MRQNLAILCLLIVAAQTISAKFIRHENLQNANTEKQTQPSSTLKKVCFSREIIRRDCEDESYNIPRFVFSGIIKKHLSHTSPQEYWNLYTCLNYREAHSKYYKCILNSLATCHPELKESVVPAYTPVITNPDYAWFDSDLRSEGCNCILRISQANLMTDFNSFIDKKPNLKAIQLELNQYKTKVPQDQEYWQCAERTTQNLIREYASYEPLTIENPNFKDLKVRYMQNKCDEIFNKELEASIYAEANMQNDILLVNYINTKEASQLELINKIEVFQRTWNSGFAQCFYDSIRGKVRNPQPEPTPQPQPEPTPQPQPEPTPQPQPEPTPQPQPEPTPQPQPEPTPQPQPEPTPQPQPEPTPQPQPEPTPEPQPEPTPQPQPEPTPEPQPEPQPEPTPQPQPEPTPEPQPEPTPQPQPEPTPEPQPEPAPQPQPEPAPQPEPTPQPQPEPTPEPQPEPAPQPQPEPAPQPEPTPQPQPEPTPEPQPEPTPQPQPVKSQELLKY